MGWDGGTEEEVVVVIIVVDAGNSGGGAQAQALAAAVAAAIKWAKSDESGQGSPLNGKSRESACQCYCC